MSTIRTRGIILKQISHGESDKLVTFYSPSLGKVTAIAKGANRSKKRFVNKLEIFSLLDISCIPPRAGSLFFLSEAELLEPFLSLRTMHNRYIIAVLACELVMRFTGDQDPDQEIFDLLFWLMESIHCGEQPHRIGALFHLRLLGYCGYQPQLETCNVCHCPVTNRRSFALQPAGGTLVCSHCNSSIQQSNFSLSLQSIKFMQAAQQLQINQLQRLQMTETTALEALKIFYRYSQHLLQRDIHSWRFIHSSSG
jgi:DNA repair protein RecO (recombination protein O)